MPTNGKVVLETKDIEKHFGGIRAVDKVSIKLYKNEIIAIVGDNGAGKSTFIKCITGAHAKDGGSIFLDGKLVDIRNTQDSRMLGIETVYQDKGLISTLDAPSNLFLGREKIRGNLLGIILRMLDSKYMRDETEILLEKIGVHLRDIVSPVSSLSGGQQQSVAVGRAIYWSAKILIFDEPTNNLGVKEQHRAIELIKNIRDTHPEVSIIVITHNLYHVFELVDRIFIMRNGKLIGVKEKVKTNRNEIVSLITGLSEL